jgi:hypothetical protein
MATQGSAGKLPAEQTSRENSRIVEAASYTENLNTENLKRFKFRISNFFL